MVNLCIRFAAAGAFGAMALATTSGVLAQGPAAAPDRAFERGHHDEAAWREMRRARQAERTEALRAVLQLRPDQEGAFQAFEQAAASRRPMGGRHDAETSMPAMTTPQRLDLHLSHMEEHEAKLRQFAAATKQFYAVLTPQQQKAFDGLTALKERHHSFGGHMGENGPG